MYPPVDHPEREDKQLVGLNNDFPDEDKTLGCGRVFTRANYYTMEPRNIFPCLQIGR